MHHSLKAEFRRKLLAHVKNGGLIAYATASCFGLGCDPNNPKAIQQLLRIKSRPRQKGLILIAHHFNCLVTFVAPLSLEQQQKAKEKWPGPHTWLMPVSAKASRFVRGRHNKIAVRVDAHRDAVETCRVLNQSIVSTSLNRSGWKPVRTYQEALRQFGNEVLVIPGKIGRNKTPSTIQDFITGRIFRS